MGWHFLNRIAVDSRNVFRIHFGGFCEYFVTVFEVCEWNNNETIVIYTEKVDKMQLLRSGTKPNFSFFGIWVAKKMLYLLNFMNIFIYF